MDDLISRRAAIDAAIEATDDWDGGSNIGRQKRIENYINSLPFAPGTDCISRQAAIDAVMECYDNDELFEVYEWKLNELPPAEPKMGKWIPVTNGRGGHECDQCHEYAPSFQSGAENLSNYCPNCGAKMEVEHDG